MAAAGSVRRRDAVDLDGLFLLDKPAGMTSNQALQKVKRLFRARKAGHTGSLDPAATGMLPLAFGEATKVCAYLLDADKRYRVTARLGEATDTGDADGEVVATAPVPAMSAADWERVLAGFVGEQEQVPPMYSALKKDGRRLYELARQGQTVERQPRRVRIHALTLLEAHGSRLVFRLCCSKGTYVRTLVEDIARAAGTVGHTAALHREAVAGFEAGEMAGMAAAEALAAGGPEAVRAGLLPADRALLHLPERRLPAAAAHRFAAGQAVAAPGGEAAAPGVPVRVYADGRGFLGIGETLAGGLLAPRRIFRRADGS